jgi:hypothetical protein
LCWAIQPPKSFRKRFDPISLSDSTNPAARTKRAPSGSGGLASSDEPPPHLHITHPPLAPPLPHVRWTAAGEEVVRARDGVEAEDFSFVWPRAFLASSPCAAPGWSRSLCTVAGLTGCMRIFFVMQPRQVILSLPGPLHIQPLPFPQTLMSGTNRSLVCHSLPRRMRSRTLDPYYTLAPPHPPPPYSGQGPTPSDPRPSGSSHYPPPPYPGQGPIPGDPRPFGSGYHHHPPPPPPPHQRTSSASIFSAGDEPPRDSSLEEDMMRTFFPDYTSYPPSYPPPGGY